MRHRTEEESYIYWALNTTPEFVDETSFEENLRDEHEMFGLLLGNGKLSNIHLDDKTNTVSLTFDNTATAEDFAYEIYGFSCAALRVVINAIKNGDLKFNFTEDISQKRIENALEHIRKLEACHDSEFSIKSDQAQDEE